MTGEAIRYELLLLLRACLVALCGISSLFNDGFAEEKGNQPLSNEGYITAPRQWVEVDSPAKIDILNMIADQTQGNYEKIRTWKGVYAVWQREYLPREAIAEQLRGNIKENEISALWQTTDFTLRFAVDMASDSLYRSKEAAQMKWIRDGSNAVIEIPKTSPVQESSVVTPEYYLHFDSTAVWPGFRAVQGFPKASDKRAAFRDPSEKARRQEYGDLMDPCALFASSPTEQLWVELRLAARTMRGDLGEDQKKLADEITTIYKAVGSDGTWYRMDETLKAPDPSKSYHIYMTCLWNSMAGFNPVSLTMAKDKEGEQRVREQQWQWKRTNDIYIPVSVRESSYSLKNGRLGYQRTAELRKCSVNEPIEPSQFSYQGLGMKDGDLVMDNVAKACYVLDNGSLEKVADYGDKYVPPGPNNGSYWRRWRLMIGSCLLILLVVVLFARQQYRKHGRLA